MFNMTIFHVPPTSFNVIAQNSAQNLANYQFYAQFKTFGVHPLKIHSKRIYICTCEHGTL